ncbi:MAG: hypothetical protein Q7T16_02525 [Candidatus Burarchaeum sp.]|nr:hypothetical protein [Candidatus Burarchaeum sp.]MDO8339510.1 hypothetical protein [Candidatus Burarchaeum sp.]
MQKDARTVARNPLLTKFSPSQIAFNFRLLHDLGPALVKKEIPNEDYNCALWERQRKKLSDKIERLNKKIYAKDNPKKYWIAELIWLQHKLDGVNLKLEALNLQQKERELKDKKTNEFFGFIDKTMETITKRYDKEHPIGDRFKTEESGNEPLISGIATVLGGGKGETPKEENTDKVTDDEWKEIMEYHKEGKRRISELKLEENMDVAIKRYYDKYGEQL